ncbi:diaminobutyrate acetyltransferase [Paenibacillus turpanensis]|uniref:diaminobutyrate acetyltransferase n=1 Tax=Paenibacillus turpanensis TaxID=2689078 RepID=UPI00140DE297|nr:diaminobutyrate acetyltransferase [Paenibacillus turpanensis]
MPNSAVYTFRKPSASDGQRVWRFLNEAGGLDVNTPYSYIMFCDYFAETCVVAEAADGAIAGFMSAFQTPSKANTFFIWQVAVSKQHRGQGLAKKMLHDLLARSTSKDPMFVEATVSPDNVASQSLFFGLARDRNTVCDVGGGYKPELFPDAHEEELHFRVGPFFIS